MKKFKNNYPLAIDPDAVKIIADADQSDTTVLGDDSILPPVSEHITKSTDTSSKEGHRPSVEDIEEFVNNICELVLKLLTLKE